MLASAFLQALGAAVAGAGHTAVLAVEADGAVTFANPGAHEALGAAPGSLQGADLSSLLLAEDRPRLAGLLGGSVTGPVLLRLAHDGQEDGRAMAVEAATPGPGAAGVVLVGRSVGSGVAREARVSDAQRFEVVGRLASGIAHELNNALSVVTTYGDLLLAAAEPGSTTAEDLEEIKRAALDAAAIIRKVDLFAGGSGGDARVPTRVQEVVLGMQKLLARFLTKDVTLSVTADDATPPVLAAPIRLEEILVALAAHARDASGGAGSVTLSVRSGGSAGSPTAVLGFSCQGTGERLAEADRAVEAPLPTQPLSSGRGIGLAVVDRVVRELGGTFRMGPSSEEGMVVTVELPACPESSIQEEGAP